MMYVSNEEPERSLGVLGIVNLAARFALSVTVGLVSYASMWVW